MKMFRLDRLKSKSLWPKRPFRKPQLCNEIFGLKISHPVWKTSKIYPIQKADFSPHYFHLFFILGASKNTWPAAVARTWCCRSLSSSCAPPSNQLCQWISSTSLIRSGSKASPGLQRGQSPSSPLWNRFEKYHEWFTLGISGLVIVLRLTRSFKHHH